MQDFPLNLTLDPRTKSKTAPDGGRDEKYMTKDAEPIMAMSDGG